MVDDGGRRGGEEEKERGATDPQLRMIICLGRKSLFHCIVIFLLLNYFPPQFHQQPITTWTHNSFCTLGQPVRLNQPWTKMSAKRDSNLLFLTGVCLLGRATTVSCVEEEHSRWHTASFNGTKYRVVPPQKRSTTGTSGHHVQLNENFRKPAGLLHLMWDADDNDDNVLCRCSWLWWCLHRFYHRSVNLGAVSLSNNLFVQHHQGVTARDHDRCVIALLNHNWAAADNQESGSCGILWSEREVILSTFDKSDHHPLAVSLVGTLWEGVVSHFLQVSD